MGKHAKFYKRATRAEKLNKETVYQKKANNEKGIQKAQMKKNAAKAGRLAEVIDKAKAKAKNEVELKS